MFPDVVSWGWKRPAMPGGLEPHASIQRDCRRVVVRDIQQKSGGACRPGPLCHRVHKQPANAPPARLGRDPHRQKESVRRRTVIGSAAGQPDVAAIVPGDERREELELAPPIRGLASFGIFECAAEGIWSVSERRQTEPSKAPPVVRKEPLNVHANSVRASLTPFMRRKCVMTLLETAQLLGGFGEFVGAIGVVTTLVYLSVQVRHSKQATEANTRMMEENRKLALAQNFVQRAGLVEQAYRDEALSESLSNRFHPWL